MDNVERILSFLFGPKESRVVAQKCEEDATKGYTDDEVATVALKLLDTTKYHVLVFYSDIKTVENALKNIATDRATFQSHPNLRIAKAMKNWFDFFERRAKEAKKNALQDERIKELEKRVKETT